MANIELTLTPASPTGSMIFTLGAPGPQGLAGTMEVGTVTTGAPGSSATIVNVGTPSAAILDFEIPRGDQGIQGIQGIQGDKGDKGDKGDQGDPGPSGVVYATAPLSYDSGTQTVSIDLSAYATQSYVTSQGFITSAALTPYLTSATAASTYQTISGMSSYLTTSAASSTYLAKSGGYITGDIQSNNGSGYRTYDGLYQSVALIPSQLQFNNAGVGGGTLTIDALGISFADGKQTVRYPGLSILNGYATESWVTSELGSYLTTSAASSTYYPLTNPSGFIGDAPSDGTIYGRQNGSWVTAGSGGSYLPLSGGSMSGDIDLTLFNLKADNLTTSSYVLSPDSLVFTLPDGSTGTVSASGIGVSAPGGAQGCGIGPNFIQFPDNTQQSTAVNAADFLKLTGTGAGSMLGSINMGSNGINSIDTLSFIAGGKINAPASTTAGAGLNLGVGTAPTAPVAGDLWLGNNINFKDIAGTTKVVANINTSNTFNAPQVIDTTSNTLPGLRVTQKGTQPVLVVEDSVNPDASALVVDTNGNVGIGVPIGYTAVNKVEIVGAVQAQSITFNGTAQFKVNGTQAHAVGANTHDLLISFNGSTYRVPMIFVSTP